MKNAGRFVSIIDQGIISAVNFLHIWLVARYTEAGVFSAYVLAFGAGLMMLRIHAAVVSMPLSISSRVPLQHRNEMLSWYHGLHLYSLGVTLLLGFIAIYWIAEWLNLPAPKFDFVIISIVITLNLTCEYIRRIMLNYYSKWLSVTFNAIYGILLVCGIGVSLYCYGKNVNVTNLYMGFSAAIIFGNIIWIILIIMNRIEYPSGNACIDHVRKEGGVILNNISQWGSGQGIYYLLMTLSNEKSVAILAVLRNLFGPLNIFLLSLEGFLPKLFASSYMLGGSKLLHSKVVKEFIVIILAAVILLFVALMYGEIIIGIMYGDDYVNDINEIMIMCFVFIYSFAFISRIILCALRVIGVASISGFISVAGLLAMVVLAVISIRGGGAGAAAMSLLVSELIMASLFVFVYRKEIFRRK